MAEQRATKSVENFPYKTQDNEDFDGTPYEAANKSLVQTERVVDLLQRSFDDNEVQVRNAWMQRNLDLGSDARAVEWDDTPEAKIFAQFRTVLARVKAKLGPLRKAATYDPNNLSKE